MIKCLYNSSDPRYIFFASTDNNVVDQLNLSDLENHLNPYIKYTLLPNSKIPPTREIFLEKFQKNDRWIYWCAAGLWREAQLFLSSKNVPIDISCLDNNFKRTQFNLSKEEFYDLVKSWKLNLEPRDYQMDAAWKILHYKLSLSELATRAGKTLIFYLVSRAAKEVLGVHNILMIVPSIHLVKQGVKDLADYKEYFSTEQIWANGEEVQIADLTIGTFQSLIRKADKRYKNYNPSFFDKFDMVCVDEAHKAPCKSIKKILALEAFKNVKLRFGFSGTLPKQNTIEWMACQAILGPKIQEISARELIDEGYLADPIINQIRIKYNPDTLIQIQNKCAEYLLSIYEKDEKGNHILLPIEQRQMTICHKKKMPEAMKIAKSRLEEMQYYDYLIESCNRSSKLLLLEQTTAIFSMTKINIMDDLISDMDKNVIVFAHNIEYIKYLYEHFQTKFPNKKVLKVTGSTSLKKRQKTIDEMLSNNNVIVVASFGVFGTGLTIKNVDYGIFAQSFKADTITRQSLGRLMLRTKDKTEFHMYDLIDVFPTKKIRAQGATKINIYKNEGHKYEITEIKKPFESI